MGFSRAKAMPAQGLGVINNQGRQENRRERRGTRMQQRAASCLVCRTLSAGAGAVRDSRVTVHAWN